MAVKASVSRLARAVSAAVRDFAEGQGWTPEQYKPIAMYDPDREQIFLVVGSTQSVDRFQCTDDLMNRLADKFGSRYAAFNHVVPVVRHLQALGDIDQYLVLHDNEIDMTDML